MYSVKFWKKKSPLSLVTILLLILLITLIGSLILITFTLKNTIDIAVSPLRNTNLALSIQVSKLFNPRPTVIPNLETI
jgi:hypothetical protein